MKKNGKEREEKSRPERERERGFIDEQVNKYIDR